MKSIIVLGLISFVLSAPLDIQRDELRRQYIDYLRIFKKNERGNSFEMFLENLGRISNRECDLFVDKTTDESLTYTNCEKPNNK
jgi:hypothetical protein